MNGHNCAVSRSLLTSDPLMKQMPFPDTNYGKQNKQKQTLKPIIIRLLTQTRWREAGAYQLLEVITKLQTIFRPSAFLCTKVYGSFGLTGNVLIHADDSRWLDNRRTGRGIAACSELGSLLWSMTFLMCSLSGPHSTLSTWATSTWLISSTCSLRMVPARNRSVQINPPRPPPPFRGH